MIKKQSILRNVEINVNGTLSVRNIAGAKSIFSNYGKDSAIIVVEKTSKKVRFIAYNHPLITKIIGRRLDITNITPLYNMNYSQFSRLIHLPEDRSELSSQWQILDGWWSEYFSEYPAEHYFEYFVVTRQELEEGRIYKVNKELKSGY